MTKSMFESLRFDGVAARALQSNKVPQMMEFLVNRAMGPFLVSSTRACVWVDKVSRDSRVRAAVRAREGLEQDVLASLIDMGTRMEWGNIQPLTAEGVAACVEHLRFYEFDEIEALVSAATSLDGLGLEIPTETVSWMPVDCLLVLPTDRNYVGTLGVLSETQVVCVVHNASRGMAVAWR